MIDAPFGKRPFRVHIDPSQDGAEIDNDNLSSGATMRTFTGSVSQDSSAAMHMAGTFNVLAVAFGNYAEYPFSANK